MKKKYGFLFGAGAELSYNMPSGGQFALNIFRQDIVKAKNVFKDMMNKVDSTTSYANDWLAENYKGRHPSNFGKSVFENIISSTVEHNRTLVIDKINNFDDTAYYIVEKMKKDGIDVDRSFAEYLDKKVSNIKLSNNIEYNENFKKGNRLFNSNYFSSLLLVYKKLNNNNSKDNDYNSKATLGKILVSIMQLQLGALSEELTKDINDNLFSKRDDAIDLFDDFGQLIKIDYKAAGVTGLELLSDKGSTDNNTDINIKIIISFAKNVLENIYASVLDYKTLIDSNWHYLYCPRDDWAKFCKIATFLISVHQYISEYEGNVNIDNPNGYYNMLKQSIARDMYEVSSIATTNYGCFIDKILGCDVIHLNGSTSLWYDPYLNKIDTVEVLQESEYHIIVPLLFTQSGTKPMTAVSMSIKYVDLYKSWKDSDAVVVVGYGFGSDDEHINGLLRTLVNDDNKELIVVTTKPNDHSSFKDQRGLAKLLKINDCSKIKLVIVNDSGVSEDKKWVDFLY